MLPGLGDLLCAVPALGGLRAALPDAVVTLVGRSTARWFVERYPDLLDDLLGCDCCPGLVESDVDPRALVGVLAAARDRRFDVAIQMHGDGRCTNSFTAALGAGTWGGLARRRGDLLRVADRGTHEIDRCVEAVRAVGLRVDRGPMTMPLLPSDDTSHLAPPGTFAVVHAGASRSDRCWPAAAFGAVATSLLAHVDHVVLTGRLDEREVVAAVRSNIVGDARRVIDAHGRTSVASLAALLAAARLVLSNDTGVAHLAAAVGAPSVTVFGAADRHRWEPPGACCLGGKAGWPGTADVICAAEALLARGTSCSTS